MADAAREAGAEVRTGAEVERVVVEDGKATGVELTDGSVIAADRVLSNADPLRTFFGLVGEELLPDRFAASLRNYRCEGTSVKINLGVDRLPEVTGMPSGRQPYLGGIMEFGGFIADMDRAQLEARSGRLGTDPHVEVCIPTFHDPSLAPEGQPRADDRHQLPALHLDAERGDAGTSTATRSPTARSRRSRATCPG